MESPFLQAHGLLRYIGLFLSGVCHQFPGHSIFVMGIQMPLCARCTGTYLGALLGLCNLWLRGRSRANRLPPTRVLIALGLFFAFWAIDGLNSYLHFFINLGLYTPSNFLRLLAGMVNGLSLSLLVFPMFNSILWREPDEQRVVNNLGELGGILLQVIALEILLQANIRALCYPLFLIDLLSVLSMLTIVNSMIVIFLLRLENQADCWRRTFLPLGLGLLLSVAEVSSLALLRSVLAPAFPFPTP